MSKVAKKTTTKKAADEMHGFSMPKPHPFPKQRKATPAEIKKQLERYEEWLQLQRDGKVVFALGDATEWIREDRTKDN